MPTEEAIVAKMMADFQLDESMFEIEMLSHQLKTLDVDIQQLQFKSLSQKDPIGLYTLLVDIEVEGKTVESSQVRTRIKKFQEVMVAADKLRRHDIISEKRIEFSRMEVTHIISQPLTALSQTEGYRVRSSISLGDVITKNDLELIPDIEVGDIATIVYSEGIFKVTAEGVAMQAGNAGEYIKLKNNTSKKIIIARIIDSNSVAIDP